MSPYFCRALLVVILFCSLFFTVAVGEIGSWWFLLLRVFFSEMSFAKLLEWSGNQKSLSNFFCFCGVFENRAVECGDSLALPPRFGLSQFFLPSPRLWPAGAGASPRRAQCEAAPGKVGGARAPQHPEASLSACLEVLQLSGTFASFSFLLQVLCLLGACPTSDSCWRYLVS